MANQRTVFDEFNITNGHVKWKGESGSEELGCTGTLALETELKTITKTCEGVVVLEVEKPVKQTGTLTVHMPVETLRRVFGINTAGLKKGVYAYGTKSNQGAGCLTFDVYDVLETMKKLVALPNVAFSGGFKWNVDNGATEIAAVELTFKALADEGRNFYYEAIETEVEDALVKTKWHTDFNYNLVKNGVSGATIQTKTANARAGV